MERVTGRGTMACATTPRLRDRAGAKQEAAEHAAQCRRELGLGIEPVANIFDILERQGLIVIRYPVEAKGLSAFIARDGDDYVVFINTKMTLGRQIFSAVHELGRLLLRSACEGGTRSDATNPGVLPAAAHSAQSRMRLRSRPRSGRAGAAG
ncbi:MAG: ImmA/IrrE family metallo-endopeptidase [Bacillota bacterium]